MANVKFSQFNLITSLSATGFVVGYDGANNTRISKANLESSLDLANLTGQISLGSQVAGTLPIGNGGTGQTTAPNAINALTQSVSQVNNNIPYYTAGSFSSINPSDHPNIPTVAMLSCVWNGTVNPYFNIPPSTWTTIPFDVKQWEKTTHNNNSLTPSVVFLTTTDTYITWDAAAYNRLYKVEVTLHFYDQTGNVDMIGAVYIRNTGAIYEAVIDDRSVESSGDKMWYGYTIFSPGAGRDQIQVKVYSTAGGAGAYPSLADNGYIRVTVSLID